MAYDPTAPADTAQVSAFPGNERAQRLATQGLQQLEHNDSDGSHEFRTGDDTARDAISWAAGSGDPFFHLWGKEDTADTALQLQYNFEGTWYGIYDELWGRQNYWSKAQLGGWINLTPGPTVSMDFSLGNFFRMDIDQDVAIANPTLPTRPSSLQAGCYFLELSQQTAGDWDISSFGSNFRFAGGLAPTGLTDGVGSIDLLQMIVRYDGKVHAEILRDSQ